MVALSLYLTAGIKGGLGPEDCRNAILNNEREVLQSILRPLQKNDENIVYLWQITAPAGTRVTAFLSAKHSCFPEEAGFFRRRYGSFAKPLTKSSSTAGRTRTPCTTSPTARGPSGR
jgi:hypothetical protein